MVPLQALASPQQFGGLPHEQRCCVLLGLWYALNWCRELVNCFSRELQPNGWVGRQNAFAACKFLCFVSRGCVLLAAGRVHPGGSIFIQLQ
jgi:hypothetical protein